MTPDKLTALAARLLNHAAMHDSVVPNDDELRQWRDDLIAAAKYLRQWAEAEPVAWRYEVRSNNADGHPVTEWRKYGTYDSRAQAESHLAHCGNGIEGRVVPLYTHPQPQPPSAQAEPTIDINIKIAVPENWSNRLDMQWIVEREIHADRWSWSYAAPQAMNTQADAIEALRELVEALDGAYISSWQSTAAWQTQLDRARAVLAAQGGNE